MHTQRMCLCLFIHKHARFIRARYGELALAFIDVFNSYDYGAGRALRLLLQYGLIGSSSPGCLLTFAVSQRPDYALHGVDAVGACRLAQCRLLIMYTTKQHRAFVRKSISCRTCVPRVWWKRTCCLCTTRTMNRQRSHAKATRTCARSASRKKEHIVVVFICFTWSARSSEELT